ncbi:hypothetical protein [Streptomyces sp. NPDC002573]|uniref:hypothetical protein n=1 Tax=Streptomyces sp. NPDC002573 TaxID=3364651 RepID=UPI003690CD08
MRTGVAAAVLVASGALLAGCTSSHTRAGAPVVRVVSSPAPAASSTPPAAHTDSGAGAGACEIYLYGHAARAEVRSGGSNPASECSSLASSLSQDGSFWTTQAISVQGPVPVVCAVQKDDVVVVVRDSGSQIFGQGVCSGLLQAGWREDSAAEQTGRQQDQAEADASAQASSRAADESAAQDALSTLQGSNRDFNNAKSMRADIETADNDLAKLREDAKGGNGDDCYNVENNVGYDAENNVGYDVTTTASYDVDQEQQGIKSLRSQITDLQNAQAALTAAGLTPLDGAGTAIATAKTHIATAITTTNEAIDHLNGDMKTAYSIANTLGTGDCANSGPGEAPTALSHIS